MLYYLFRFLEESFDFPGAGLFGFVSFRAAITLITSLFLSMIVGKHIINFLKRKQIGETIRELGLAGENQKKNTPTMGGIIILIAILLPCLLFGRLRNIYLIIMLVTTAWLGLIGGIDDYIKVFKKNKDGLNGKFKVIGQVTLGLFVGLMMWFSPDAVIVEHVTSSNRTAIEQLDPNGEVINSSIQAVKSNNTTIPFIAEYDLGYSDMMAFMGENAELFGWLLFVFMCIFVVTACSNGANLTDGIDGLAAGTSSIIGVALAALAVVSSNVFFADYLNIQFIPGSEELVVFAAAFIGATVGFLWYNAHPAQVFMGDTGSLALGGIIGVFAILVHKELLLPILCGIFLVENLSVIIQTSYFKYTKKKYGAGRRVFLMSPLHHHYQKKNIPEQKIVARFWIIGIALAIFAIVTLKIR
ncbi:MAG: phospho-N-acetylmuramoyl-pentapeptide-transferase [Paludibacteraceae bacterium]|nr:phospho-N-acetylmuramoyl-pentapeptide-transferase [Paludibacteraceae bacterium]MBR2492592.1 phospho-N-acetylmuramoyl-pentapeptide-transferase [Paludibacteraceae bacterium]MBR6687098.1 phospho-N-acetylmuramoyl-pentapeptide-transferase [Paludibacteraceae bacterium]